MLLLGVSRGGPARFLGLATKLLLPRPGCCRSMVHGPFFASRWGFAVLALRKNILTAVVQCSLRFRGSLAFKIRIVAGVL